MRQLLLLTFLLPALAFAQNAFKVIEETSTYIVLEYKLEQYKINTVTNENNVYNTIEAENLIPLLQKGLPELYKASTTIALPAQGDPSFEIIDTERKEFNNINILPSKGSLKRNVNPKSVPLVYDQAYAKDDFFPTVQENLGKPFLFRNARGVVFSVSPFAYNPVTKTLVANTHFKVKIHFNKDKRGTNESLNTKQIPLIKEEQDLYKNKFINYNNTQYTPIAEQGSMLVICADNFVNTIKPLTNWKNQKGIKTTIVPISQIGNNQTSIYNFIQGYYSANPDLLYLLFVGDHAEVNAADAGMAGSEVKWSDTYYTFLNGGDHYPELFVGRFSGSTITDIQIMVDRTLEYEKSPATGNWYTTAIGIGSNEGDGYGDDGEADWQHERNMGIKLLNWGYTTFHEFFDGTHGGNDAAGDPTTTMVSTEVNNGASLFMYTGHGWEGGCATSNYSSTEVASSTNNGKYPFAVSVACNNGTFTAGTCFAEEFVRAKNNNGPTGAIACSGSSILMAWAEPMAVQDEIVEILTDQYSSNKKNTLGGLFYNGGLKMLEDYNNLTAEEVMETWVLFGDPSCVIRTQLPTQISATYDLCYSIGSGSININSTDEGALVALSVNDSLLGTAIIQAGSATIPYTINTNSPLTLTLSAYNKLPLQSSIGPCAVSISNQANETEFSVYPNPAYNEITISAPSTSFDYLIVDALGRVVQTEKINLSNKKIDISTLAGGLYTLKILSQGKQSIHKIFIN